LEALEPEQRVRFDMLLVEMFSAWSMTWLYEQERGIDRGIAAQSMENLTLYHTLGSENGGSHLVIDPSIPCRLLRPWTGLDKPST
jgi:hypothetical protein